MAGLIAWVSAASAAAQPGMDQSGTEKRVLDSAQSSAAFSVKVLWMFGVEGQFGRVHGDVFIDHDQGEVTVDAHIDAADVTMRRENAQSWVKSPEFFDVEHYPDIRFRSEPFALIRLQQGGEVSGTLSMRGVTRPVVFAVQPSVCKQAAVDCPVEASATVRRSQFGMTTRRATLSDKVELSFSIRMSKLPGSPVEP